MSEAPTTATPPAAPAQAAPEPPAPTPPVESIDWKAMARKWEQNAKDNKGAADELATMKAAQMTEAEKATEALRQAQSEAATSAARALRYEVAAAKGLDLAFAARLTGSTKEELEADADTLMALIPKAPPAAPPPPAGPTVPGQQPGGQSPALITQSDLDALGAAGKHDEINRLRRDGRLTHLGVAPPKTR